MTVKTGRYVIRRSGVEVDASGDWTVGPATSSADVHGVDATLTWHRTEPVSVMETDHTDDAHDGETVEIFWVDEDGEVLVFTGTVDTSAGQSLAEATSRLTDGTERLTRSLDLRPMAYTLPVHPANAGHGGRERHVGLFGIWFTHQAMVHAGFDPGVPMHWSAVWYQSMCGSVATVPDKDHAFASLGDLRSAWRMSDPDLAPGFVQDENQYVAEDVHAFGVTSPPKAGTADLPWQLTWDLPIAGIDGELILRNLSTSAGVAVKWSTNNMSFYRHNGSGTQDLLGTLVRDRSTDGDKRWTVVVSGSTVIVRTDARGEVGRFTSTGISLPTGQSGLCTVREDVPGLIGPVAVTRGDRQYMTTEPPKGRILRADLSGTSLPGWPSMPGVQAGRVLADQADAHRGLRGQPIRSWINHEGLLVNVDFDSLAARPVVAEFDTRPDSGTLALDLLSWATVPAGGPFSGVQVTAKRMSVARRSRPTLLLDQGSAQALKDGDDYEVFLTAESGTTWLEPDLRPLMAGYPYPSPPYDPRYKDNLNREEKSWVGGHRFEAESGDRRGWLPPYQLGWTVDALGHVVGAMRQIDPGTVIVEGKANLPLGPPVQDASTSPDPSSEGLWARRKEQDLPQLRGYGLMRELDMAVDVTIEGVDARHAPTSHDCGFWVQSNTGLTRIASYLHSQIVSPTPSRTAKVEQSGRVRAGDKVLLRERRRDGILIEEEIVVTPVSGSTYSADDSMTITGVVTARRVTQTDPDAPPVDVEDEWVTPPPPVVPEPPRSTLPPRREDDPIHDPENPPGTGPVKPSTPTLSYDAHGLITSTWDGLAAAGGSAVDAYFGAGEVALGKIDLPADVVGSMRAESDGTYLFSEPSIDYGTQWWVRIRIVDRWGRISEWSDAAGPVEVVPMVDPGQFDDLRDLLDDTRQEIVETGAIRDQRLDQAENDLAAANNRLAVTEAELDAAFGSLDAIAAAGSNLVPDGDMEANMAAPSGAGTIITGDAYSGTRHARMPAAQGYVALTFPWAQAVPGMVLRAGFAARKNGSATSGTLRFAIEVERADGSIVSSFTGTSATPATLTGDWQAFTQPTKVTLSATAVRWRARPYYDGMGEGIGSFDVDLVTVYDATNATALEAAQDRLAIAEYQINTVFPTRFGGIDDAITVIQDDVSAIETATGQKIVTSPTPPNPAETDIWIDTSTSPSIPKYHNGTTWEPLTDPDAIADALAAALEHANNLPKVLHGTGPATGDAPDGSVWFQHEGTIRGRVIAQWVRVTDWVETPIDSQAIANLDVGKLTAGSASISDLVAERIAAASGQFLSLDVGQLVVVDGAISNLVAEHFAARTSSLIEADIGNLVVTGSSTMSEAVIERLWVDVVSSKKITADMVLIGSGVNLIVDPGFTNDDLNASRASRSSGMWSEIGVSPYGGTNRFRLSNASTGTETLELRADESGGFTPIDPGETYRSKFRAVMHSTGSATVRIAMRYRRSDGTLGYVGAGAYQPIETDLTKIATAWHEFTWTAPADAVEAAAVVQVNGAANFVDIVSPSLAVSGASLIVDGTIAARHINALSIASAVGEFVYVEANHVKSGLMEATIALAGEVILSSTNGRITTADTGSRVELKGNRLSSYSGSTERTRVDSTGLRVYGSGGTQMLSATASGVSMVGSLTTGTGAGRTLVDGTGIRHYNGSNVLDLSATAAGVTLTGSVISGTASRGISIFPTGTVLGDAAIEFRHENFLDPGSISLRSSAEYVGALTMWGPIVNLSTDVQAQLHLEQQSSSNTRIWGRAGRVLLMGDGQLALESQGAGGHILLRAESNEMRMQGDGSTWISGIGNGTTTTQPANTHTALDGRIRRSTSITAAKVAITPLGDEWQAVKALEPVTWFDRGDSESYAAAIESGGNDLTGIGYLTPQVGFLAEQAEAVGAPGVPTYDNDGSLSGVAYSRVAALQQKWLHELETRITQLEENP